MDEKKAIVLIFASLVLREMFLLFPEDPYLFDPFPLADIQINTQLYAYFAFFYIAMALIAWAFLILMPSYSFILTAWFFLQIVEVVDYFLTYNTAWFHVGNFGVSITIVKFTILAGLIIHRWTRP